MIAVTVKPGSKADAVERTEDGFIVRTKARAVEGRANEAVMKLLAEYMNVPKSRVRIVRGMKSRHKIIEIEET